MSLQTATSPQPRPGPLLKSWIRIKAVSITLLAWLWRPLIGIWSSIILAIIVGILGNAGFTLLSTGTINLAGMAKVFIWLHAHLTFILPIVILLLIMALCSLLAHLHERQVTRNQQHVQETSFQSLVTRVTDVSEGMVVVKQSLAELKQKLPSDVAPSSSPSPDQGRADSTRVWNIPYPRNPFFVGRDDTLSLLHTRLWIDQSMARTQPQGLSGLGGIGKTQTALEYAYRYGNEYATILWISADTYEMLQADARESARVLGLLQQEEEKHSFLETSSSFLHLLGLPGSAEGSRQKTTEKIDYLQLIKKWLESNVEWLLILDNVEDLRLLQDILPRRGRGHVLLTTRLAVLGDLAYLITIERVVPDEGARILLNRAQTITSNQTEQWKQENLEFAKRLSEMMDGLPLALDQAGAYIQETQKSVKEYVTLYTNEVERARLLQQRGEQITNHPESVTTTFTLSFEKIKSTDRTAAYLLQLCAFLHPDAIPEEVLTEAIQMLLGSENATEIEKAIKVLLRYSLLRRNPDSRAYTLHRVLQAVLKDTLSAKQQQDWAEQTITILNHTPIPFDERKKEPRSLAQLYLPQAQQCAMHIKTWNIQSVEAVELLNRAGAYMYQQRQYGAAQLFYEQLLHITEQRQGSNDLDKARTLSILANLTYLQKADRQKLAEAALRYQEALHIYERELVLDDPRIGQILTHYGMLLRCLKRWREVEVVEARARQIGKKMTSQAKRRWVSRWIGNLNVVHWYDGYALLMAHVILFGGHLLFLIINNNPRQVKRPIAVISRWITKLNPQQYWYEGYGLWLVWGMIYSVILGIPITLGLRLQSWWLGWGSFLVILLGVAASLSKSMFSQHATGEGFTWRVVKLASIFGEIFLLLSPFLLFIIVSSNLLLYFPSWSAIFTHWPSLLQVLVVILGIYLGIVFLNFCAVGWFFEDELIKSTFPKYTILPAFTFLSSTCVLPILYGLLLHSWWVFGGVLLGTWLLFIFLAEGWNIYRLGQRHIITLIFACLWGYLGWIVAAFFSTQISNNELQLSLSFLLALVGFSAAFFCHHAASTQLHVVGSEGKVSFVLEDCWVHFAVSDVLDDAFAILDTFFLEELPRRPKEEVIEGSIVFYPGGVGLDWTSSWIRNWADFYSRQGFGYTDKRQFANAITSYTMAIINASDVPEYYLNRGKAYYEQGDYTHAIADYDQAILLNPKDALYYHNRGLTYIKLGDYTHAIADFDQAISLDPNETVYHTNRDKAYQKQSDHD